MLLKIEIALSLGRLWVQMEGPLMRCKYLHAFLVSCFIVAVVACSHYFWCGGFRCCACGGGFDSTRDSNQAASLDRDASDGLFAGTVSGSTSLEYPSISPAPPNLPSASPSISPAHFSQLKADHHSDGEPASATVGWGYRFPRVAITAMIALALAIGV